VPRPNFRWTQPDDDRDIVGVLIAEGVLFDQNGAGDQSQRIDAEELLALIEFPGQDDVIEELDEMETIAVA
jgi:hypothetical protein